MSSRPDIDIRRITVEAIHVSRGSVDLTEEFKGATVSIWEAECPLLDCKWSESDAVFEDVEDEVWKHQQWHEDGMPA